jgi:hypothetical protein
MVVNFRTRGISRGTHKLIRTPIYIYIYVCVCVCVCHVLQNNVTYTICVFVYPTK